MVRLERQLWKEEEGGGGEADWACSVNVTAADSAFSFPPPLSYKTAVLFCVVESGLCPPLSIGPWEYTRTYI